MYGKNKHNYIPVIDLLFLFPLTHTHYVAGLALLAYIKCVHFAGFNVTRTLQPRRLRGQISEWL